MLDDFLRRFTHSWEAGREAGIMECIAAIEDLEGSYLIQNSDNDGAIVKASHMSRTMALLAVREVLHSLMSKGNNEPLS